MYSELLKHAVDRPFHFNYALSLFSELLPLPLPIPIPGQTISSVASVTGPEEMQMLKERVWLSEQLLTLFGGDSSDMGLLDRLIRVLCSASAQTATSVLLKRVFVQLSDVSEAVCARLSQSLLGYGMELFYELTNEKSVEDDDDGEVEMEEKASEWGENGDEEVERLNRESCGGQMEAGDVFAEDGQNGYDIDSIYDTGLMDESAR